MWLILESKSCGCPKVTGGRELPPRCWIVSGDAEVYYHTSLIMFFFRSNFIFGMVVPKRLVAFSDPTLDGKEFAKSYMKDQLLIY